MSDGPHHQRNDVAGGDPSGAPSARGRSRLVTAAAVAAFLVGGVLALVLVVGFTAFDDPCPDYDDEGTMAAPDSPYSTLMCDTRPLPWMPEMETVGVPLVLAVAGIIGLLVAFVPVALVRRGRRAGRPARRRTVALWLAGVLVVQPLVVLAAQYGLPRDCLSGRTPSGECSRDREVR